jgi:TusA-related sulfurtransferase
MPQKVLDCRGMKCPMPVLKMTQMMMKKELAAGDILDVIADCPTFETDVKNWVKTYKKVLVRFIVASDGKTKTATVQI